MRAAAGLLALLATACATVPAAAPTAPHVERAPFTLMLNTHIATAPFPLVVRLRYDPATTRGYICVLITGPEDHTSCWFEEGNGAPLMVLGFNIGTPGEYAVEATNGTQRAATTLEVN